MTKVRRVGGRCQDERRSLRDVKAACESISTVVVAVCFFEINVYTF